MPKRGRESSDTLMAIDIIKFNRLTPGEQRMLGDRVRATRKVYYFKNDGVGDVDDLVDMIGSLRLTQNDIIVVPPVVADNIQNSQDNEADTDAEMEDLFSRMTINGGKRSRRKSRRRRTKRARKSRRRTHRRKRR
tara:strand:- start:1667 stop:2071 length:405 start_codon:yes stop_codon:yes gene_type:complete